MAIPVRTVSITGVFAEDANTTIPTPPVPEVSYRDTTLSATDVKEGWPFKKIVDSAKFNEAMYEYSTILQLAEKYGFIPWSANTDYEQGSCALGTDGIVYQAKQNTGPSSTAQNPVNDTSHTYWDVYFQNTFTAYRVLVSNASGKPAPSSITSTKLGYLSDVTSNIQAQINAKAADSAVVKLTGAQTVAGTKTFSSSPVVPTPASSDSSTKSANTAWVNAFVAAAISSKLSITSYATTDPYCVKFSNGLLIQWGQVAAGSGTGSRDDTVNLRLAYNSTNYFATAQFIGDHGQIYQNGCYAFAVKSFKIHSQGGNVSGAKRWFTIGWGA